MKKIIWLLIIILSVNLLFFPKYAKIGSLNRESGEYIAEKSAIYLAPIWTKTYSSHLISFVPSNFKSKGPNWSTSVWNDGDSAGNILWPKLALDIWAIFFLLPSVLILSLFVFFKKIRNKSYQ